MNESNLSPNASMLPPRAAGLPPRSTEPEQNLFGSVRTWTDIFPWLRLVRVLRVAGGPIWIAHTFAMMLVWLGGLAVVLNTSLSAMLTTSLKPPASWLFSSSILSTSPGDLIVSLSWPDSSMMAAFGWGAVVWTSLLWLPTSMMFIRAGALLTAGREMPSYLSTLRLVLQRLWAGLVIVLLPLVCTLPFWGMVWGITAFVGLFGADDGNPSSGVMSWLSVVLVTPLAIVAGLLLVAGKVAVPLGLANLMTMNEADPMDSLSRGYEYTLRRLPQLLGYSLIALLLSGIVTAAWIAIGLASSRFMSIAGLEPSPSLAVIGLLLSSVPVMLTWSMFGGVYLLLRQSAGGQEVEDIWAEPDAIVAPKMPSVERD